MFLAVGKRVIRGGDTKRRPRPHRKLRKKNWFFFADRNKYSNFVPDLVREGRRSEGSDAIHLAEKTV